VESLNVGKEDEAATQLPIERRFFIDIADDDFPKSSSFITEDAAKDEGNAEDVVEQNSISSE